MALDLDTLKAAGSAIGILLAAPVALVWKRSIGSVQKDDLKAIVDAINKRHEDHASEDQTNFAGIFSRINDIAESNARIEGYLQAQRERRADG